MRRRTTLAALMTLLLLTPAAHAIPVVGYAQGTIAVALFSAGTFPPHPIRFTVGATAYLEFRYDTSRAEEITTSPGEYRLRAASFRIHTSDGNNVSGQTGSLDDRIAVTDTDTFDRVVFDIGSSFGYIRLVYTDPTGQALSSDRVPLAADLLRFPGGTLELNREVGLGSDGFRGPMVPVATPADFPVPEPSGLALGVIGMGLVGFTGWRKRR